MVTFVVNLALSWGHPQIKALQFCQNDKANGIRYFLSVWLVNKAVEAMTQNDMEAGPLGSPYGQKF